MIIIENLSKKYGKIVAVKDLNIEIESGKIFGFLGPNGAGKTTTIKILMGILAPDSGRTFINNLKVCFENSYLIKRKTGYVPEEPLLYDKLTGYEFLEFICRIYEIDRQKTQSKIEYYLKLFEMSGHKNKLLEKHSKGMKKIISIISAMIHEPEILILDEPTEGLDPKMIYVLKNLLLEEKSKGKTVFLSTHVLQIAEELVNEIGIINEGELIFTGSIDQLREQKKMPDANLEKLFIQLTHYHES